MSASTEKKPDAWDRVIEPWWAKIIIGLVMILFAWWQYSDFTKLEAGLSESMLVGRTTKVLYDVGGKWLPVGATAVVGVAFIAWGAVQIGRVKK